MALPTVAQMTNWYLYGTQSVPANLVDDSLIRPATQTIQISADINEYMNGPGRFAPVTAFEVIQKIFLDPIWGNQNDPSRNLAPYRGKGQVL